MGGLTAFDWPAHAVELNGDGLALALLALPANAPRPIASQHARQALRQILGGLLARPADALVLRESGSGPVLENAARDIRISLSYAAGRYLIGLAEGHALGVDIVRVEHLPETGALAQLYLPAPCRQAVHEAPPDDRNGRFALAWAQMEARSKCLGLPLGEMNPQRERALAAAHLTECAQIPGYRMAAALKV